MELELIFISEISQLAPELFFLIAGARGSGSGERVQCGVRKHQSLPPNIDHSLGGKGP